VNVTMIRQRVPMLDASTLEDRTRPAVDDSGWLAARLGYLQWPSRSGREERVSDYQVRTSDARLGRR
jgi:hypothetical protein